MKTTLISILDAGDYRQQVERAAGALRDGQLVVLPTETVYGAAAILTDASALARLKGLRGATTKPLTVHIARRDDAMRFLGQVTELGARMMRKLWPGAVALMFDVPAERRAEVARQLEVAEADIYDGSNITLRCPDHIVTTDVLAATGKPVALTAIGSTGSMLEVTGFTKALEGRVDLIIDAGATRFNKPSTIIHVVDDRYDIVRAGVYDQRIIDRMMRTTVLFICSGNTCRSPMAEAIARRVIADKLKLAPDELEAKGFVVMSAGSFSMPGSRATPEAVEAVRPLGGDLSKHRSRPLAVELVNQADVVYTMGRSHRQSVLALVPSASDKTFMLDPDNDIEDPIGGDASLYRELAVELKRLIETRLAESVLV